MEEQEDNNNIEDIDKKANRNDEQIINEIIIKENEEDQNNKDEEKYNNEDVKEIIDKNNINDINDINENNKIIIQEDDNNLEKDRNSFPEENININENKEEQIIKINNNDIIENNENKKDEKIENSKEEIGTLSIDAFLKESQKDKKHEEIKKIELNAENKNGMKFDKRKSTPLNALNFPSIELDNEYTKDDSNNNNKPSKKKKSSALARSYSEAIVETDKKSEKKNFYNELFEDPKYHKIIELKEKTENSLKKTVGKKGSSSFIKTLVSRKKARFCYDGFDLDLTYITTNIIAMGLPSTSIEGIYRNNMEDVKKFFNTRHPKHHKIYNLCEEKTYPKDSFYLQGYYPFPDHEAPPLNSLMPFCKDAKKFLEENEENVVAIHCKAGKGRTGTFICCLLLYLGLFDSADECMKYYGLMRVNAEKGVTVPSQKRYVNYFEQIIKNKMETPIKYKSICIIELKMNTIPHFSKLGSSCTPTFIIQNNKKEFKYSDFKKKVTYDCSKKNVDFPVGTSGFSVAGDVLITFFHLKLFGKDKMFKFWFNTHFLPENGVLEIGKKNLDKAFKDKENKLFSSDFKIEVKYFFL